MDESNGNGIVPDAAEEHSAVLSMLASDSWQSRLDEARKAREAVLAKRGATQDLPARLKSAAPRLPTPSGHGQVTTMPGSFPPATEEADVEPFEAEEEFPEFFPETEDDPPGGPVSLAPVPTPYPWAHVPAVGPARPVEPAHTGPVKTAAQAPSPLGRPFRIAAGFGLGLAAGVAATSLAWMMAGPTGGSAPRTEALAPAAPVVVPQTAALSPPDATPPSLSVTILSRPPEVTVALAGAGSPPEVPPNGPEITGIERLARLSGSSDLPLSPAPPALDAQQTAENAPAARPTLLANVADASFALQGEKVAVLPSAFAPPALQAGLASPGTGRPDPAPRAAEAPPVAPQAGPIDPVDVSVASAGAPPRPLTVPEAEPELEPEPGPEPKMGDLDPHQVNVMAPESIADADLTATLLGLQGAGFRLGENDRVSFKVSKNHVRFYHETDRAVAEALAARIGAEARDFTASDYDPPEGMIELWLQGSGPKVAAAKPAKPAKKAARSQTTRAASKERKAPSEDSVIKSLRDKIVRQLQKGEHL